MGPDKENRGGRFHTPPHRRPETSPPKSSPRGSFLSDAARREGQPDNSSAAGNLLALGTSSFSGAASLAASAVGALSPRRALAQQQRSSDPGGLGGARPAAAGEEVPHPPPQGLRARPAPSGNDPGPSENRPSSEAPTAPSSGLPSDMLNQVLQATTDALKSQVEAANAGARQAQGHNHNVSAEGSKAHNQLLGDKDNSDKLRERGMEGQLGNREVDTKQMGVYYQHLFKMTCILMLPLLLIIYGHFFAAGKNP